MSDHLVEFEDLAGLDSSDLRSVFAVVDEEQILTALAGATPGLRRQLLIKVARNLGTRLEAALATHGPVTIEAARDAQAALVDALCRLSRGGHIAFDPPEDMVA